MKSFTVKTISAIASPAHLVAQTTADLIAHSEGYLVSKITKEDKSKIIAKRRAITKQQQKEYKKCVKQFSSTMKSQFTPVSVLPSKEKRKDLV